MSHFVERTELKLENQDALKLALEAMGHLVEMGVGLQVNGWNNQKRAAELVVRKGEKTLNRYDFGFTNRDGNFVLLRESMDGALGKSWENQLKKNYAEQRVLALAKQQGMLLTNRQVNPKTGAVSLVFAGGRA